MKMKYLCNFVCEIDGQKYPLYELENGKYLQTIYKDNLYIQGSVKFKFYDNFSGNLVQTLPIEVSTQNFIQMEFDRWIVGVKLLEEIIDKERWL